MTLCLGLLQGQLYGKTQPPVTDRILRKTARFPFPSIEPVLLEDAKGFARETHSLTLAFKLHCFEWNPPQCPFGAAPDPPIELGFLAMPASRGESEEHTLDRQSPDHLVCRLLA